MYLYKFGYVGYYIVRSCPVVYITMAMTTKIKLFHGLVPAANTSVPRVLVNNTFSNTPSAVFALDLMYPNSPGTSLVPNTISPGDSGDSLPRFLLGAWPRTGDIGALFALDLLSY